MVQGLSSTVKDEALIVDDQEKKMTAEERKFYRENKLKTLNNSLYEESTNLLRLEGEGMWRCWRELAEFNVTSLQRESQMWIDIMDRGVKFEETDFFNRT